MRKSRYSMIYVYIIFAFLYLPILFVVIYSFNVSEHMTNWTGFTLDWYKALPQSSRLIGGFLVSLRVGAVTALISAVIGAYAAVLVEKLSPGIQKTLKSLMFLPLIIPEIITGIALLIMFSRLNVPFGEFALVLSHSTFCVPYVFIMVSIRLSGLDASITEAARDLGASAPTAFVTVVLPNIMPGIVSGALLAFAMSMDDVIISIFMAGPASKTMPVEIYSMLRLGVNPMVNALCSIFLLFTFLVVGVVSVSTKTSTKFRGDM